MRRGLHEGPERVRLTQPVEELRRLEHRRGHDRHDATLGPHVGQRLDEEPLGDVRWLAVGHRDRLAVPLRRVFAPRRVHKDHVGPASEGVRPQIVEDGRLVALEAQGLRSPRIEFVDHNGSPERERCQQIPRASRGFPDGIAGAEVERVGPGLRERQRRRELLALRQLERADAVAEPPFCLLGSGELLAEIGVRTAFAVNLVDRGLDRVLEVVHQGGVGREGSGLETEFLRDHGAEGARVSW